MALITVLMQTEDKEVSCHRDRPTLELKSLCCGVDFVCKSTRSVKIRSENINCCSQLMTYETKCLGAFKRA